MEPNFCKEVESRGKTKWKKRGFLLSITRLHYYNRCWLMENRGSPLPIRTSLITYLWKRSSREDRTKLLIEIEITCKERV